MTKRSHIIVACVVITVFFLCDPTSGAQFQIGAFSDTQTAENRAKLLKKWNLNVRYGRSPEGYIRVRTRDLPEEKSQKIRRKFERQDINYFRVPETRPGTVSNTAPVIPRSDDTVAKQVIEEGKSEFTQKIKLALNQNYNWGNASLEKGFDCSGLVQWLFEKRGIPRTVQEQWEWSHPVTSGRLKTNYLLFFQFDSQHGPDHVGIYRSKNHFYHASVKYGVTRSELTNPYYLRNLWGIGRLKEK